MSMEPLALYIHWPFCLAKCPYCDFNSHVRDSIDQARFSAALRADLAWEAARLGPRPLGSIFFGGGTPSLMDPATVSHLIDQATAVFDPQPDLEITLEANPTSVETSRLNDFRLAGVNRVSLGIQALDPAALAFLGRHHSATQALGAFEVAQRIFPRVSFDLIYARPEQTEDAWRAELRSALSHATGHLSLYQLTIEAGTSFEQRYRRGEFTLPDPDLAARLHDATNEEASQFGLQQYEISNYARSGQESQHNLTYWRYGDYAGIGPGAHGRLTFDGVLVETRRHRAPESWAAQVEEQGHGITDERPLSGRERAREMLLMGLRLNEGVDAGRFFTRTGIHLPDALDSEMLRYVSEEGYVTWDGQRLIASGQGRLRLDALLACLVL